MACRSISLSRLLKRTTIGCVRFSSAPCFHKRCCSQIVGTTPIGSGSLRARRSMGEHSAETKSQRPDLLQPVGPPTPTGSFVQRRRRRSRRSAASATGCWRKQPTTPGGSARLSDAVAEGDPFAGHQIPGVATELNHSDSINSLPVKASGCRAHSFGGQESTVYNVFHPDKNTICHGARFRHELPIASGRSDQVVPATKATGCKNFV
jgi:hypothetical protein